MEQLSSLRRSVVPLSQKPSLKRQANSEDLPFNVNFEQDRSMPPANKKTKLPSIKLSQNIRKAIEKNVCCEEDLIKTLHDVELKKRAAINEIVLKKDAFLRQQRQRRESLPDVLGRNTTNHSLVITRRARNDLECSAGAHLLSSHDKTMTPRRIGKLPSLPVSTVCSRVKPDQDNDKESSDLCHGITGMMSNAKLQSSDESLLISEGHHSSETDSALEGDSGVESVLGVQSWPTSPSVQFKSIMKRRKSVADIRQANNMETTGQPSWLRRQTLHHILQGKTIPPRESSSDSQISTSTSDPCSLPQTKAEFFRGDSSLSRYRKVLNRRRSLQAPILHQSCLGSFGEEGGMFSKSLQPPLVNRSQNSCRLVSFQELPTEPYHNN